MLRLIRIRDLKGNLIKPLRHLLQETDCTSHREPPATLSSRCARRSARSGYNSNGTNEKNHTKNYQIIVATIKLIMIITIMVMIRLT